MTDEHLAGLVARLYEQGHTPQQIYDALIKRIATKLARRVVFNVTGYTVRHRTPSAKTRAKISASRMGQARSPKARAKISVAKKQYWAAKKLKLREGVEPP